MNGGALSGRVHLIGIGGAGMSAIAKVLLERGVAVSGSDLKRSPAAAVLEAMGATIHLGHDEAHVRDVDVVVMSSAIPERNPELVAARAAGLPVLARGDALARVLSGKRCVIVAGTHGKTTTTSMIVSIMRAAGVDATYLVGGGLNESGTNARSGSSDIAVAEADESDGSFLLLDPAVAVVTNVEVDHVDHWATFEELKGAFTLFLGRVRPDGTVVIPEGDAVSAEVAKGTLARRMSFGESGDVSADDIAYDTSGSRFVLVTPEGRADVALQVPGAHNVSNALAAAAASLAVGVVTPDIAAGLSRYRGVERRYQVKGSVRGATVIDDYAHHPTEVRATLSAARSGAYARVVAVFQPHRYSRTAAFWREFGDALSLADRIVLTDVYGAGEEPVPGVTGKLIADAACEVVPGRHVAYLPHRDELVAFLEASLRPGDALLTLGAGDVTTLGDELLARAGAGE